MPIAVNKIADLAALSEALSVHGSVLRIHVDHVNQISALERYQASEAKQPKKWSAFAKIDCGDK